MKIFGLTGWSGSGKTTTLTRLLPELLSRGLKVSTLKHAHHEFDVDQAGKDSYRHRAAGASEVLISSRKRWVLMHEHRNEDEAALDDLIARMTPVDLLLIEGFKRNKHKKMEIHRHATGAPLLAVEDENIVAVASDVSLEDLDIPTLDIDDTAQLADFIMEFCDLKGLAKTGNEQV